MPSWYAQMHGVLFKEYQDHGIHLSIILYTLQTVFYRPYQAYLVSTQLNLKWVFTEKGEPCTHLDLCYKSKIIGLEMFYLCDLFKIPKTQHIQRHMHVCNWHIYVLHAWLTYVCSIITRLTLLGIWHFNLTIGRLGTELLPSVSASFHAWLYRMSYSELDPLNYIDQILHGSWFLRVWGLLFLKLRINFFLRIWTTTKKLWMLTVIWI